MWQAEAGALREIAVARGRLAEGLERRLEVARLTDVEVVLESGAGLNPESVRQHFAGAADLIGAAATSGKECRTTGDGRHHSAW